MAGIKEEYHKLLEDLEKNINNQEDLQYVKDRTNIFMNNIIEYMNSVTSEEDYDTEIVCPYCESEFLVDLSQELKQVQCPECNNTIELDWTGNIEEEPKLNNQCGIRGNCSRCSGCTQLENEEDDDM